ncbi:MAG: replication initiation protein [Homoserinimonas sp.]
MTSVLTEQKHQIRYEGITKKHKQIFLDHVDKTRVQASRDREFQQQRWAPTTVKSLREFGYAAFNNRWYSPLVVVDIDSLYDHDRLSAFEFPPNLVGLNTNGNGHGQLIWFLETPVYGTYGRPREFLKLVSQALNALLDGDPRFTRGMARNPLSNSGEYEWHFQHGRKVGLRDLHDALPEKVTRAITNPAASPAVAMVTDTTSGAPGRVVSRSASAETGAAQPEYDDEGLMRKQFLFDEGKRQAYKLMYRGEAVTPESVRSLLIPINDRIARMDGRGPLDDARVRDTARRISVWVNANMTPGVSGSGKRASPYHRAQASKGGRTTGAMHAASGHMAHMTERSEIVRNSQRVIREDRIRRADHEALVDGRTPLTNREMGELLGVTARTISSDRAAIRAADNRVIVVATY